MQVVEIGCIMTLLYSILILPIMLLYRSMEVEMEMIQTEDTHQEERRMRVNQKYPPLYHEGKKRICIVIEKNMEFQVLCTSQPYRIKENQL